MHTRIYTCQLWGGRTCPTCVTCHLCGMDPCHGMHRCRRSCTNPWGKAYSHACTRESKFSDLGHPYHISSETCISRSQNLSGGDRSVFSLNRTNRCAHSITRDPLCRDPTRSWCDRPVTIDLGWSLTTWDAPCISYRVGQVQQCRFPSVTFFTR